MLSCAAWRFIGDVVLQVWNEINSPWNLLQRPVVIDWKDITSDFHSDLMHISAGKLDGADLRPRELWTMNEFKIFQCDQFK